MYMRLFLWSPFFSLVVRTCYIPRPTRRTNRLCTRAEIVNMKKGLKITACTETKFCVPEGKHSIYLQSSLIISPLFSVPTWLLHLMLLQIQHYHEQRTPNVASVGAWRLFSFKLLTTRLMRVWPWYLYAAILPVVIVGESEVINWMKVVFHLFGWCYKCVVGEVAIYLFFTLQIKTDSMYNWLN